ncbi:DNA polymerase bacteriophage-type [Candidatus Gastranaerophilus sp. (ex Termes propinquus)]|nr:DNA polymerase bacteriophage-type [Candidatus Gastranaerophilus sp. (ex Termes propinquus)]
MQKLMQDSLTSSIGSCEKCALSKGRNNVVLCDGDETAKIMLIGEAPGKEEDAQGKPFVGRAGKLLDELLKTAGVDRQSDLYICNIVKCRPPDNRKPEREEKEACRPYLISQIKLVKPRVIILCGAVAMESFIKEKTTITKARGRVFENPEFKGVKFVPVFHPSYLLRNHSTENGSPRDLTKKDLMFVKQLSA